MLPTLAAISALLLSVAFLLLGHGLLLTLLPVSASALGFTDTQVALTGSSYFLGFVTGCMITPFILKRVGHIRSFAVLATTYSIVVLIFPWIPDFWGWLCLRFFVGVVISGLYMIIESWLNDRADAKYRGSILSIYTMLTMMMIMCGQQLLNLATIDSFMLFSLVAIFISIAIIPVSLTLTSAPAPVSGVKLNIIKVWEGSHVGLLSAVVAGLVTGAYWSLAPIYAKANGFSSVQLTIFMSATVLGAACFQWPLGRISDSYDRRRVLMLIALVGVFISLFFVFLPNLSFIKAHFLGWATAITAFFWGGACMTLYAIGLAHANDSAEPSDFVEIGSAMLITYGLFSAIGAPAASFMMNIMGASGMYAFCGLSLLMFFIVVLIRRKQHVIADPEVDRDSFVPVTQLATPNVYEIDPRVHEKDTNEQDKPDPVAPEQTAFE